MANFLRCVAVVLLCLCVVAAKPHKYSVWLKFTCDDWSSSPVNVPSFAEFPPEKPARKIAKEIDFKSHRHARRYRTSLREGLKEGANFNGHYNVVTVGCGTGCQYNFVLDVSNGRVLESFYTSMGNLHRLDSALLVKNQWKEGDIDLNGYILGQQPIIFSTARKGRMVELHKVETRPLIQLLKP